jgi:hypothetical protein
MSAGSAEPHLLEQHGRLVEIEGVDPSKREEVLAMIRERIIPGLKEIEGFAGFIALVDEESRRARSVVLFETKEAAEEAERQLRRYAKRLEQCGGKQRGDRTRALAGRVTMEAGVYRVAV